MKTTRQRGFAVLVLVAVVFIEAACTSAQVIATARVAVTSEIAAASADGWSQGVIYGNAVLNALGCIATADASTSTAALKIATIAQCGIVNTPPLTGNATENTIVSVINATLDGVLIAYGVTPATASPQALAARSTAAQLSVRVYLKDGSPGYWERRELLKQASLALAAQKK